MMGFMLGMLLNTGYVSPYRQVHLPSARQDQSATPYLVALAFYFFLQFLIRICLSDSLELDEAELVFLTQQVHPGYGTQPPLYAWMQRLMFSVFGLNLFSLAALKNLLLLAAYLFTFQVARPMLGSNGAMAAAASLLFFPQIGWESQRDLSHSVLLTTLAGATLWQYFAVLRNPSVLGYAFFGLLIGLGMQSKYNFAAFLISLACASLLVRGHREILWSRKLAITVTVAVLVFLPHGLWLLNHLDIASAGTLNKMAQGTEKAGYLQNVRTGFTSLAVSTLAFIAAPMVIYGVAGGHRWKQAKIAWNDPNAQFLILLHVSFFAVMVLLVLTGQVGRIRSRWMQPLLYSLPLVLLVALPALANKTVFRRLTFFAGVVALAFLLMIPMRVYLGPKLERYTRPHYPFPELTARLADRFPHAGTVLTENTLMAGNLRFHRPELRTLLLGDAFRQTLPLRGEILLVLQDDAGPEWIKQFRTAYPHAQIRQQGRLTLPYRFGGTQTMSFKYFDVLMGNS